MRPPAHARTLLLLLAVAVTTCGCDDLDEFRTGPDKVFHGEVIGSDNAEVDAYFRAGFASHTEMELTFDAVRAASHFTQAGDSQEESPGSIETYVCPVDTDLCPDEDREPGHFGSAELERIPNLAHDALSQYDFPGGGRLRNYIFGTRFQVDSGTNPPNRHAMVFLSLMESGRIEVRVISPGTLDADGEVESDTALFGVFVLERKSRK